MSEVGLQVVIGVAIVDGGRVLAARRVDPPSAARVATYLARNSVPMMSALRPISGASQVAARPIAWGKTVA